jgi:hypothetical protein
MIVSFGMRGSRG